jgi:hypothetical protein
MTEADLSKMNLGVGGAIIISAWLTHKDRGGVSSINLLKNWIPVEQAKELVQIMQAKENLNTLCGLSREDTELDFSGQNLGAGDAVLIANDISDMRALSWLNLSGNGLAPDPKTWNEGKGKYYVASTSSFIAKEEAFAGVVALAGAIKNMGTLTKLDISSCNYIAAAQGEALQRICAAGGIELAK